MTSSWTTLLALCATALISLGCDTGGKPAISVGVDACSLCNMVIDTPRQACGYFVRGAFKPFDSPACMLRSHDALSGDARPTRSDLFFADYRTGEMHSAEGVALLLTDHVNTVMNGRVICFGDREGAQAHLQHEDERVVDWMGYRLLRGAPDRREAIQVHPGEIRPASVAVRKGELVELVLTGRGLRADQRIGIRGYEEVGAVRVSASGEPSAVRFWATRPGDGFPVVDLEDGKALGMLKVLGPHTSDEEAL